jgi:hypothetical protein
VALTDDQKAMLRLLAQRGEEGYEDMAALMGISVEEVRKRVREAMAAAADGDSPVESPAGAEVAPTAPAPTPPSAKAEEPSSPPPAPEPPVAPAPAKTPVRAKPARMHVPSLRLPKDRGALIGLGAGALAVLIFAIVLIVSGGGSGSTPAETSAEGTNTSAANSSLTEAILSPVDGGDSSGKALFGRYKKSVLLQVEAEGLAPSPQGQSYTIWLYRSPRAALQVGALPVGQEGKIVAQFKLPAQLLAYVASGAFNQIDVALTDTAQYRAALAKAKGERTLPPHIGESVLRGRITGPAIR